MSEKVLIISPKGEERYLNAAVWNRVKQNSQFAGWVESGDYEGGTSDKIITKLPPEVEEMQRRMMEQTKTIVEVKPAIETEVEVELPEVKEPARTGKVSLTTLGDMVDKPAPKKDSGKAQPVGKKKAEK